MLTLVLLVVLIVILLGGAGTYPTWGTGYHPHGRTVLWLLAVIAIGALIVMLINRHGAL